MRRNGMRQWSDDELVDQLRGTGEARDLRAFEELVRRHQAGVVANCRYLSGSAADAEDLAQEVFVKAFFGIQRFEGRAQFRTWIRRVKTNHCLNHLKRRKLTTIDVDAVSPGVSEALQTEAAAERELTRQDIRMRIDDVLRRMTETLRIPLVLRDMDELSYQEIADELGIGLSAVKMRIKRGREEFRRLYEDDIDSHAA